MGEWLRGPLRPLFEDVVLGRAALAGLSFDRVALRARFERHVSGSLDDAANLWALLALALWEDRHAKR
jgi:hypothetical protein